MTVDERYMLRCLELAQQGAGSVSPNPMVGCVVVHNNRIIGEGWHQQYGGPHAEVNAINSLSNPLFLSESTVYVNLEPCNHFGKTPPCADLLIRSKVKKVVVGMVDPFKEVMGTGIQRLKDAGIEVVVGVLEAECKELNKRFITFHQKQRPYVILKWAQTADGYIAPDATSMSAAEFASKRLITGAEEQLLVHKWRGEEDAVLVGTRTALLDNPALNTRAYPGHNPLRVVIDANRKLPTSLKLFDGTQPTLVFTTTGSSSLSETVSYVAFDGEKALWPQLFNELYQRNIQSIIVEGGTQTLTSVINSGLWDEMQVFVADKLLNTGIKAPTVQGSIVGQTRVAHSTLTLYKNI
jgi:diaminohydroxyphosphoribosylaminopyrimidine deaminase/5-amino-6-(5-phosphoribosylamino)uracil reductase